MIRRSSPKCFLMFWSFLTTSMTGGRLLGALEQVVVVGGPDGLALRANHRHVIPTGFQPRVAEDLPESVEDGAGVVLVRRDELQNARQVRSVEQRRGAELLQHGPVERVPVAEVRADGDARPREEGEGAGAHRLEELRRGAGIGPARLLRVAQHQLQLREGAQGRHRSIVVGGARLRAPSSVEIGDLGGARCLEILGRVADEQGRRRRGPELLHDLEQGPGIGLRGGRCLAPGCSRRSSRPGRAAGAASEARPRPARRTAQWAPRLRRPSRALMS